MKVWHKQTVILLVLIVSAATILVIQQQSIRRLSKENQTLEQQANQLTQLSAENERLSNLVTQATGAQLHANEQESELLKLRGEVGRLRQADKDLDRVREENRRFRATLAKQNPPGAAGATEAASANYLPRDSWAFVGYATPEAALQSGLWAANSGDVNTFFASVTGEMQADVKSDLETKSQADVKAKMMDEVAKIKSCRILNREVLSDEEIVLTVAMDEGKQDATTAKLTMKKIANDWKFSGKHN